MHWVIASVSIVGIFCRKKFSFYRLLYSLYFRSELPFCTCGIEKHLENTCPIRNENKKNNLNSEKIYPHYMALKLKYTHTVTRIPYGQ